jgi:hypothetical protein
MFNIKSLLQKTSQVINEGTEEKENIIHVIQKETGIVCTKEQILISQGVVTVTVSPIQKTPLFIKKSVILSQLKGITDIR